MKVGLIQYGALPTQEQNIAKIKPLLAKLMASQPDVVFLPEAANMFGTSDHDVVEEHNDVFLSFCQQFAKEKKVTFHVGSCLLRSTGKPPMKANRGFLIDHTGAVTARYDKIHMFDAQPGDGISYNESSHTLPGEKAVVAALEAQTGAPLIGLSICYDLRFPALYDALSGNGATILSVPAAFTKETGQKHWEILLRARAIENRCFVIACGQCGTADDGRETFGHSMVIDPEGVILGRLGHEEGLLVIEFDWTMAITARKTIPNLLGRRPFDISLHNKTT